MTDSHLAQIQWLSSREGGRQQLPPGPRYTTVARFEEQGDKWTEDAWSLVVEYVTPPDEHLSHIAKVHFLASGGPSAWMHAGAKFELMEGPKIVARGQIIGEELHSSGPNHR